MNEFRSVVVCSALAVILIGVVLVALTLNPWLGVALGPVLLAVAAVIRAVRGTRSDDGDDEPPTVGTSGP